MLFKEAVDVDCENYTEPVSNCEKTQSFLMLNQVVQGKVKLSLRLTN
jgi:hypothetical protein